MSAGNIHTGHPSSQGTEALLFTGTLIQELTPDQLTAIGDFASRMFGVQMHRVQSVERELTDKALKAVARSETETRPVPATRDYFRQFAQEHGYTDQRGCKTWASIIYTARRWYGDREYRFDDPLPPLVFLDPVGRLDPGYERRAGYHILDLRTVHARLTAPDYPMQRRAWGHGKWARISLQSLGLLAHIVNEKVRPEKLLPTDPKDFPRQRG